MKLVTIVQARMSSSRLPGKILADLGGRPLLNHVVGRARRARTPDLVVVATTNQASDDPTARYCSEVYVPCFRGSEDDVLDRYVKAARHHAADAVVRLTADCPLLDPDVIDQLVEAFLEGECDYVTNTLPPTYPDGLDVEIVGIEALERAWHEARLKSEREHVTPYIRKHPQLFRLMNIRNHEDLSGLRWTVDEERDLEFVRRVLAELGGDASFGMADVLALLRKRPELKAINTGIERNEGYRKSLQEDGCVNEEGRE